MSMSRRVFTDPEILLAAYQAAHQHGNGWATASAIRHLLDGRGAQGTWARNLWRLEEQGLLEFRRAGTYFVWRPTRDGIEALA